MAVSASSASDCARGCTSRLATASVGGAPSASPQAGALIAGGASQSHTRRTEGASHDYPPQPGRQTQRHLVAWSALIIIVAAAVFAILSLIWLTQALVDWLATKLGSHTLAALIVGGVLAVIVIGLGLYGRSAMVKASLVPRRTIESLERGAGVLTESVPK